jgi:ankyrin repeat protein
MIFNTALHAAVWAKNEGIVQLLLKYNADPNVSREDCGTALQTAAFKGNVSICKQLLKANADVNLDCKVQFDPSDEMKV